MRRTNLSLVMRTVARPGPWSRARIASETGLNKATVSSLVADLIDRSLIREGAIERGGLGRPGQLVDLDPDHVIFLGVEINVDYIAGYALDLTGSTVVSRRIAEDIRSMSPEATLDRTAVLIAELLEHTGRRHALTLHLAIPGMIDTASGRLVYAPNLKWHDVDVVDRLAERLDRPGLLISADNEANLAAVAEYAAGSAAGASDLVLITGEVGIGGGVISGGALMRGSRGYSGEFGHMALTGSGDRCGCGRTGCWEAAVGLDAILRRITDPDDALREAHRDLPTRLAEIVRRADAGDERTLAGLRDAGRILGRGASVLVNVFNPSVIMFGGTFAALAAHLAGPLTDELFARIVAPDGGGCRVAFSTLGFDAAGIGGAHVGIEKIIADPTSVEPAVAVAEGVLT